MVKSTIFRSQILQKFRKRRASAPGQDGFDDLRGWDVKDFTNGRFINGIYLYIMYPLVIQHSHGKIHHLNRQTIYFYGSFSMAMLNNQRVYIYVVMDKFNKVDVYAN